jgi:hypothetical protein
VRAPRNTTICIFRNAFHDISCRARLIESATPIYRCCDVELDDCVECVRRAQLVA